MPIPIHTHPQDSQNVVGIGEPTFDINCSQLESVGSSQYLTMTEELCTAYKHVKEVFGKVGDELKLTKPESEGSVNVTTDPDLGEGKFGFLKFKNDKKTANSNRLSQFIQLPSNAEEEVVVKFINDAYQLPPPRLILSIQTNIVDIKNLPIKEEEEEEEEEEEDDDDTEEEKEENDAGTKKRKETKQAILHGLSESIKITSPWVITNGINNDMNRLVGEALNTNISENYVPCIGLCDWPRGKDLGQPQMIPPKSAHSTHDSDESLDSEMGYPRQAGNRQQESSSCFTRKIRRAFNRRQTTNPSHNDTTTDSSPLLNANQQFPVYIQQVDSGNTNNNLEVNHTHFLLFDNDKSDWRAINKMRLDIEYELSKEAKSAVNECHRWNESGNDIPIVILLLDGDSTTLEVLSEHLDKNSPIVVVKV
ncbi:unnamed protein product [Rotaria magnacalcarata]|uniref:TRPM SLOG domain-containing protein n=2 Tax=Rotaria magnacalcarata TaxID=392030 RepID=A0A816KNX9_9BILA|nr:unnamed protein product [Rotaria magnacalcarata]